MFVCTGCYDEYIGNVDVKAANFEFFQEFRRVDFTAPLERRVEKAKLIIRMRKIHNQNF